MAFTYCYCFLLSNFTKGRCNMASDNRPVHEVRLGRVKAAAFANETERGVRHGVTFTKLYKQGDEWKSGSSFDREDLPLLAKVADEMHTLLYRDNGQF